MSDEFFHGYALNAIDAKSRLSIPADFRDVISARSASKELRVGPAERADCLIGYDKSYGARLKAQHDARFGNEYSRERDQQAMFLFGSVTPLLLDDAGRIVVSATLKDLGDLDSHAWFVAGGDWFEIWNPYRYLASEGVDPRLVRVLKREMAAKGLPLEEPRK